jgi:putative copper resistance protein D
VPRLNRLAGPAVLVLAAFAALLVALFAGGASRPLALADPGAVVRFGLPIATLVTDLAASLAIGSLALACFALTPSRAEWGRALDLASGGALVWTVGSCATGFLTFVSVSNVGVTLDAKFGQSLAFFLTHTSLGVAWLVSTLVAAAVTVLCFAVRSVLGVLVVALIAGSGLIPIAEQGHAAGATSHDAAVTALGLHIEGAAVWLGGLVAVVVLRPVLERRLATVLSRYSTLALLCFVIVSVSGVASAAIRIGSWAEIGSAYGLLVVAKAVALVLLGLFGVVHRRVVISRLDVGRPASARLKESAPAFWWFVAAELGFLGIASGIAAALARTATPVSQTVVGDTGVASPAEVLTGRVLPPALTALGWLTRLDVDLLWLLACALLIAFGIAGARRIRARGDAWPVHRTILWVAGLVVLAYATSGAPHAYDRTLMSAHLVTVALAALIVPALLVPSAPWTLALLTIRKRTDGSRGPREWLMGVVQSRVAARLTHPLVGPVLLVGSIAAWIHWPWLLRWSVTTSSGHLAMVLQLVLVGWLAAQSVVGVDPVPTRAGRGARILLAGVVAVGMAALGVALAAGSGLLLANWYGAMGRLWGLPPVADQQVGGVVIAVVGVVVALGVAAGAMRATRSRP